MEKDITPDVVKVSVLGEESIILGFHLINYIFKDIITTIPASSYVLFTDSHLALLYLKRFKAAFTRAIKNNENSPRFLTYSLTPGEPSKSRETKSQLEDFLLSNAVTRDTCIIALGGGVIGDLVGFVAATFMRGVPFVQIPTTLLAMVDSSIGGKTAVDTPHGKNLIGAFWQPKRIFMDLNFLKTLPEREFVNGMAEVIKTAAIWNEEYFVKLENKADAIREAVMVRDENAVMVRDENISMTGATLISRTPAQSLLLDVILVSCRIKAHIITVDERETEVRGLLNFGHSIGHAIEAILTPEMLHGECVAIGMIKEAEIARNLGHLNQVAIGRITKCLQAYGLPISLEEKKVRELVGDKYCYVNEIMNIMKLDKKNLGNKKKIVLLSKIGKTLEPRASYVADDVIRKVISPCELVLPSTESVNGPEKHFTLSTPGSKSISNRALVLAALGQGICRVKGLLYSDDTQYMLEALRKLNAAEFEWEDDGETLVIQGYGGKLMVPDSELYVGNAGTASRFLTTVLTLIPPVEGLKYPKTILTGNARMKQRPILPLLTALKDNGADIKSLENEGFLPIEVVPTGGFKGGKISLAASISSQYVSSILMCAPYAQEEVTLCLTGGRVISQPYIDMTITMMETFGAKVERLPDDTYRVAKGIYTNPLIYVVESDASSASYPLAMAAITGTTCTIPNIGSSSLQGDAGFAVNILKPMGCTVEQTDISTTVIGPPLGKLRPLPSIDMETMTDAFLTATVLAAAASSSAGTGDNITRITGIANQRLKECNRIAAMVHELAKFGVSAEELPDGILIHGKSISTLKPPEEGVHCYDDHRIAMSFSVLATVVANGTIIKDKKCVEKTWPGWWDDLENKMGVQIRGVDLGPEENLSSLTSMKANGNPKKSVLLIGLRGAGKTTLGNIGAHALGRQFLDLDMYFESTLKTTIPDFVKEWGWEKFRVKETEFIKSILAPTSEYSTSYIIACGGGIVETSASRELLKQFCEEGGKIVHIIRDIERVEKYLNQDTTRPMYGESLRAVWKRRQPWYNECANFEFVAYVKGDEKDNITADELKAVKKDFVRFLQFITRQNTNLLSPLKPGKPSTFVSLTYKDVREGLENLVKILEGNDAVEIRVDLLKDPTQEGPIPSVEYVGEQVAILRRHVSNPIIFTVRSKSQGGRFPDDAEIVMTKLLKCALKWACEYVDMEICLSVKAMEDIVANKGNSRIIASWHDPLLQTPWESSALREKLRLANKYGDIIKLIGMAKSLDDNFNLENFRKSYMKQYNKPLIALNMGALGQLSRVLNDYFTPITHPLLTMSAAPGQLSLVQIYQTRHLIGLLPAKNFYLFGTPIQHSVSPILHNTGFEILGLPYKYSLFQCSDIHYAKDLITDPSFGGASVTIPHKLAIIPLLDEITKHAKAIGAVNTIISKHITDHDGTLRRVLIGDNTDFRAIVELILSALGGLSAVIPQSGLVIGAGGTARAALYALHILGIPNISLFNRTSSKAISIEKELESQFHVTVQQSLSDASIAPEIIISTIPGDNNLELPINLFSRNKPGIFVELAYKPQRTKFSIQAEQHNWKTIRGVEILIEQGYWQFEAWTGRNAPRVSMAEAVMAKYNEY